MFNIADNYLHHYIKAGKKALAEANVPANKMMVVTILVATSTPKVPTDWLTSDLEKQGFEAVLRNHPKRRRRQGLHPGPGESDVEMSPPTEAVPGNLEDWPAVGVGSHHAGKSREAGYRTTEIEGRPRQ